MIRKDISQQELLECVNLYEKEVRNAIFIAESEENRIYRYKAARREKLVVVLTGNTFANKQEALLDKAMRLILSDANLSDNVDLYTTGIITEKRAEELESPLRKQGLSVSFFDQTKMEESPQFVKLRDNNSAKQKEREIDPSFFDYLALSNDSTDIKNSFFYSLLLMEVYRHEPVTEDDFYDICQTKYSRDKADIKIAIKNLRKLGKLTPLQRGGVFSLTDDEMRAIEKAIKEARQEEASFKDELGTIVRKYGYEDASVFYDKLKSEYLNKYKVFARDDDNSDDKEKKSAERLGVWNSVLKGIDEADARALLSELKHLCDRNDYMDQYGLIHSFLDLFRSENYERYIKQKQHYVYLDTPVVVNYICAKSAFQNDYEIVWNNAEFNSAIDLFGYCDEAKDSIKFVVPHDYLQEALGELKKALQFSWFNQFENLPIPVETANVFYNYYLEVKKVKSIYEDNVNNFTFEAFAKQLGLPETNTESIGFFNENLSYLRFYLKQLGCDTLNKVDVNRSLFDEVKTDYVWYLHDMDKDKSDLAINADVRQSLHITEEAVASNYEKEYYLVSWDNTLYQLRNKVKTLMEIAGRSYNIFKPGELAEKLAFRSFRFSKESVSKEVFAYANTSFDVKEKIRSLYDNVLNPFFASCGKSNSSLVIEVLKMQKASMEGEEKASLRDDKTALETIFLSIISTLPKYNCSTQNLKDYLNDDLNNPAIIPLFTQAFEDYKKGQNVIIANTVCELVKDYVSKDDKEIKL